MGCYVECTQEPMEKKDFTLVRLQQIQHHSPLSVVMEFGRSFTRLCSYHILPYWRTIIVLLTPVLLLPIPLIGSQVFKKFNLKLQCYTKLFNF